MQKAQGQGVPFVALTVTRWRRFWAAATVSSLFLTFVSSMPIEIEVVILFVCACCMLQFLLESYGVRVSETSLRFPIRPLIMAPMISVGLRAIKFSDLTRATISSISEERQDIILRAGRDDFIIHLDSNQECRSLLRILRNYGTNILIRKKR